MLYITTAASAILWRKFQYVYHNKICEKRTKKKIKTNGCQGPKQACYMCLCKINYVFEPWLSRTMYGSGSESAKINWDLLNFIIDPNTWL